MRQKTVITKLLQSATEVYHKVRQVLQSVTVIIKWDVTLDLSELWIDLKCNKRNYLDYWYLENCNESWYCIKYWSTIFRFNSLSSKKLSLPCFNNTDNGIKQWKELRSDQNSSLLHGI